jgi:hypothetical protein
MSWKRWLPEYQVPQIIDRLVEAKILKDKTSDRDIVPHFETKIPNGSMVVLWVDHPDPEWRAVPDGPRYGIDIFPDVGLKQTVFGSNKLRSTLIALQNLLQQQGMRFL